MKFFFTAPTILTFLFSFSRSLPLPEINLEPSIPTETLAWQDAWEPHGPCGLDDYRCMNEQALSYVNDIRKQAKLKPLLVGTEEMLKEALNHSRLRAPMTSKMCGGQRVGRNFARNHISDSPDGPTDPAMMCIQRFEDSPTNYAKLVSKDVTHVVMGAYINTEGYLFCTQTFWSHVRYTDGSCSRAHSEKTTQ